MKFENTKKIQEELLKKDPEEKLKDSVRLIKSASLVHNYTIAFSGGKDSVMLQFLAKEAGIKIPMVYNNTTIDPPHTIPFCLKHGCEIIRPSQTFFELIQKKGWPTMFRRFCCRYLKEQYIADYIIIGIRKSESVKRSQRYSEPESCYKYPNGKKTIRLLPILDFLERDIEYFTKKYCIEHHPHYYDESGQFCVNRRLGCIACPLKYDRGVEDFQRYPNFLRQYVRSFCIYQKNHNRTRKETFWQILHAIFYSKNNHEKFLQMKHGLFDFDPEAVLKQQFPNTCFEGLW